MSKPSNAVFISYRREASWTLVEAIYQRLTEAGIDTFYDIESLRAGEFERVILNQIRARPYFLLVLTPGTLERCAEEGDWLLREIETAVDSDRIIVPLYTPTFDLSSVKHLLPGELGRKVSAYQAVEVPHKYFRFAMERLIEDYLVPVAYEVLVTPLEDQVHVASVKQRAAAAPRVTPEQLTAQELFERAQSRAQAGDSDGATAGFDEAIRINPELAQGRPFERTERQASPVRSAGEKARRAFVAEIERLGYRLGSPYLNETSKNIYYADDVNHKKPRIVLRGERIRIEKPETSGSVGHSWRLWKSFSLENEVATALATINQVKGRPSKKR